MECNKEEAIRAKEIAEKKMQNKDYYGARKVALKAQQLYPDLENISQLIMVCDVHCSADSKAYGNEKDWYGILKIDSTADEASIKKQYRKFALSLHPDKNKFAGATDAFKLIGEAQRVLLDREKRILYDRRNKTSKPHMAQAQQQASTNPNSGRQPWAQNHFMSKTTSPFTSFNPQQQPQKQPQWSFSNDRPTFWTVCPYCSIRYQYFREVVNKLLFCQSCKKSFTGYEIKDQATVNHTSWGQPNQGASKPNNGENVGPQINVTNKTQARESTLKPGTTEVGREPKAEPKFSAKVNGKRKKQVDESSESCDSESSESEEEIVEENGDVMATKDFGCFGENLRRSTRSKTNISYKEKLSDDEDLGTSSKRGKSSGSSHANGNPVTKKEEPEMNQYEGDSVSMEEDLNKVKQEESEKANEGSSPDVALNPEIYDYPDPDFSDFDKDRREECFALGQIWAVYDTLDAMPRYYARIRKVFSSYEFKLRITWLEPDPDDEDELKWADEGLPVSCGRFRNGNTENTEDRPMFSHLVYWEKGSKRDTYKIYPRKGETWALFKNWDIKWYSDHKTMGKYEFEFVEVLSDYAEDNGVSVAYLGKVKGFSCLFSRIGTEGLDSFRIPTNQLFRFSHRVPSFRLSGEERDDVPKNSFELDPASLPTNLQEIAISKDVKMESEVKLEANSSGSQVNKEMKLDSEENIDCAEEFDPGVRSNPEAFEIPDPEFYNFDGEKSPEKFQNGQIWALYGDEDGLPKYYALIKKINRHPELELHLTWLVPCLPKNSIKYADKRVPICCGMFKHHRGESTSYTDTRTFSHQLRYENTDKKDVYAIFPKKGEVWALYKNWNSGMTCSDLEKCEYDMVEVLEENDFCIKVLVLEMVSGYNSVFKAQIKGRSPFYMQIVRSEWLRFSHQIPAFRLTNEKEGSLRGYWELDPAALPIKLFSSS